MTQFKKTTLPSVAFTGVCLLLASTVTGCHSSAANPLLTQPKSSVAEFVYKAEAAASKQTHLYDATESVYIACKKNHDHFQNPFTKQAGNGCTRYFKAMVQYAQTTKVFSGLTLSHLKDKKVLKRIQSTLEINE